MASLHPSARRMNTHAPIERFWNVPNSLTVSRLVLTLFVLIQVELGYFLGAFALFVVAALTDALDGYFARLLNQSTALGRQLDPLVDKVVVAGLYIELLTIPGSGVAAWMTIVIVSRELLIQGLRSHLEGQGQAFGAKWAGKLKTLTQCLSIGAILLTLSPSWTAPSALILVRDGLTWAAVLLTIYSGLGYVAAGLRLLRPDPAGLSGD